ncbi:MAG: hypothetical protein FWE88_08165 [Phycisphaerae bacterium]|nr:hypothetical protein [Phycisphaerae bacterium]
MSKEYNIRKASGQCVTCGRVMAPQEEFAATLRETEEDFVREDYCLPCWQANPREGAEMVGVWRGHVPPPADRKRVFVDDEMLVNLFHRLEEATEPAKVNFRFVLALVLMRKKMLVYDKMEKDAVAGLEIWRMHFKGQDQKLHVTNPHLDEEKIAEVSGHLGEILQGEL